MRFVNLHHRGFVYRLANVRLVSHMLLTIWWDSLRAIYGLDRPIQIKVSNIGIPEETTVTITSIAVLTKLRPHYAEHVE